MKSISWFTCRAMGLVIAIIIIFLILKFQSLLFRLEVLRKLVPYLVVSDITTDSLTRLLRYGGRRVCLASTRVHCPV